MHQPLSERRPKWEKFARTWSGYKQTVLESLFSCFCLIFGVLAVCWFFGARMPFGSVDAALHYLLVDNYLEWTPIDDPVMDRYPALAHAMAAVVAKISGFSPFLSMHYASLAFMFLVYAAIFRILQREDLLATLIASTAMLASVVLLRQSWSIYGFEIVGNFFFSQAAGEAVWLAAVLLLLRRDRSAHEIWLLPLVAVLLGAIYPLAQIKWAATSMFAWALFIIGARRASGEWSRTAVWQALALFAGLSASVLLNPTFYLMFEIAQSEGSVNPALGTLTALRLYNFALLCVGIGLAGLAITREDGRAFIPAILALSISSVAGLQDIMHLLGYGSEYSVRKHTFAIISLLIASSLVLLTSCLRIRSSQQKYNLASHIVSMVFAATAIVVLVNVYAFDRSSFLEIQDEVRNNSQLRGEVVSLNTDLQAEFNYILSLVDFRIPRVLAVEQNLSLHTGYSGRLPKYALTSNHSTIDKQCLVKKPRIKSARLILFGCV